MSLNPEAAKALDTMVADSCPITNNGWIYYCDEHDTHGNADSRDEAQVMADAHECYFSWDDKDEGPCDMFIVHKEER